MGRPPLNLDLFPGASGAGDRSRPAAAAPERSAGVASPLADRMRPRSLDAVLGQPEVVGEDGVLRAALREERVPSLIFWGPPGSGKTTLARLIVAETRCTFVPFSAVTSGIREIKDLMAEADRLFRSEGRPLLLFVDEIHRFNRAQQDAFLPYVESGAITLIGATTENPSFEINGALLSRCRVVCLQPLAGEALREILRRALADPEHGLGELELAAEPEAIDKIVNLADGDARRALNLLELAAHELGRGETVVARRVERLAQRKVPLYDKSGEEHFNLISALHKSLRESDPDAALYWLQRMLAGGEDPRYVARRLVRFASEDIGLADPAALGRALAGWQAYERLGSPEGDLAIAQVVVDLALTPKSVEVYRATARARRAVEEAPAEPVPMAIRNAPTGLMRDVGYGRDYVYAPDTEAELAGLECLPPLLRGQRFYTPGERGEEARLAQRLRELEALREEVRRRDGEDRATGDES